MTPKKPLRNNSAKKHYNELIKSNNSRSSSKKMSVSRNSPVVRKQKLNLITRLIENFESNVNTSSQNIYDNLHQNDNDEGSSSTPKRGQIKNAFKQLMMTKGGTQEKTPVKRRLKRLDMRNPTESGCMDLRNWAKKRPENRD